MSGLLGVVVDPFSYEFMVRALLAVTAASIVCGVLSCWLVLIGWSLMGDAVSHAVLPGVVLAYVLGWPFVVGALVFGVLAVVLIGAVRETSGLREDAVIGIVFTSLFALGLVLISVIPSQTDLGHILFGNLLGVSREDLLWVAGSAAVALAALLLKRRDLVLFAFDPLHAQAIGLSPRRLSALLLGLLALTSVVALQAVGVVLVVAMLVIPGATARLLTDRFGRMLLIAPSTAVLAGAVGLVASYHLDTSSGPMVVLAQSVLFALAYLFSPSRGLLGRRVASLRRGRAQAQPVGVTQTESVAARPSGIGSPPSSTVTESASE